MKEEILKNIRPVKIGKLPAFLKAIEPLFDFVTDKDFSKEFDSNFIRHLAEYIEPLIEAVCIGSGADRKWLEEQDAQVLVELTAKIIEVNVDFFAGVLGAISVPAQEAQSATGGANA